MPADDLDLKRCSREYVCAGPNVLALTRPRPLSAYSAQFYSWYYHALPFLLWQTGYPVVIRLALLMGVEFGYNVFPATPVSSAVLQVGRADCTSPRFSL